MASSRRAETTTRETRTAPSTTGTTWVAIGPTTWRKRRRPAGQRVTNSDETGCRRCHPRCGPPPAPHEHPSHDGHKGQGGGDLDEHGDTEEGARPARTAVPRGQDARQHGDADEEVV